MGYDVVTHKELYEEMEEDTACGIPEDDFNLLISLKYHIDKPTWPLYKEAYRWSPEIQAEIDAQ